MIPQASSGSPTLVSVPAAPETTTDHQGIGALSAELLVICLDPAEATQTLVSLLQEQGMVFTPEESGSSLIRARITGVTASLPTDGVPQPDELERCSAALCRELQTMTQLRLVLVLGVSAHITALGACGIPLTRLDFRPGDITRLPDGLLLADACHLPFDPVSSELLAQRRNVLMDLIPKIRAALRPSA
ncbi:hypothetical protein MKW11_09050 [Gluconobacter frateurii]|uniref:hypothetical protein n=1 Tax=Gluconobacter frateurii TaxID=38308 RepID=UPI001F06E3CB|nr:hypothetical protein [Gluconobacter frateurii]UMM07379.1 hypothetical protein MKW11_09050 [Gluconobacter frateurii]